MLKDMRMEGKPLGSIDFNKLVPMPDSIRDKDDTAITGARFPAWYSWSVQNWGTKWNAYMPMPLDETSDTMEFCTAWSAVPELMQKLSERYPEQTIAYRWADEDLGYNLGQRVYKAGRELSHHIPEGGSREAYEMAAEILNVDLEDLGYRLTPDKATYRYREPTQRKRHEPER